MRFISFKYSLLHGKFPAPIIPLQVKGPLGWREVWGYVDSGASFSIFGAADARRLGIDLTKVPETYATVGDGSQIAVYPRRLSVKIGPVQLTATIAFSPRLGVGFNLIGRKDIFERFDVTFRESKRLILFRPIP